MVKNAEVHTKGATPAPTRLAMNRLGPRRGAAPPPVRRGGTTVRAASGPPGKLNFEELKTCDCQWI